MNNINIVYRISASMYSVNVWCQSLLKKKKHFIHQRPRDIDRQREKQTPCGEPDVGLDPGILGSQPEPKADAQPLSHSDAPGTKAFNVNILYLRKEIMHLLACSVFPNLFLQRKNGYLIV